MTLTELQVILGERIKIAVDDSLSSEDRKRESEISQVVVSLAKQMINNADVVLRADKLSAEGKLQNSNISRMI